MTKPMITIHNIETGNVEEREMNNAEFAHYNKIQTETAAQIADEENKVKAKNALLERLGITAEEAALLLS